MSFNPFEKKEKLPPAYFRLFQQESENLVNKIIDHASVLMLYIYVDGTIALCNRLVEEMIGRKRESIVGDNWLNIIFSNNTLTMKQQVFKAVMEDCIKYRRPNHYNGAIKDVNAEERFISWSLTPIFSESKSVHGVLCVGNDMTALKEKEASVKKIDDTLKDILSSIKEYALYAVNLNGNITYYGMGSDMIFGWKKEEIIFKHMGIFHLEGDAKSKLPAILDAVNKSGQYETEIEMVRKDGQTFPVILTVSRFLGNDGAAIGYIFIAKDITERKKMEFQIFQAEKMAAVGQLSAGMAHEVNNPLFVISGRLEMLLEDAKLDGGLRKELEMIKSQSDRIRGLVDRLLKFSRYHKTKTTELLDLNSVIESVVPFLDYQKWSDSKVVMEKDLAKDLLPVDGNLNELQEVFINLFLNAYQAMPEGGTVSVKTRNIDSKSVEVRISDTGPGITEEDIKNMFMPFFTTKKEGTGLGLSISYNIIKNHNGSINIETRLNTGTSFIIKLPIAKEKKDAVV
jgi:PAS domain S-box-containing protein